MAFYLSKERNEDVAAAHRRYLQYLEQNKNRFPPSAFALATSDWYYLPHHHDCPHDGWLESIIVKERDSGERGEIRETEIRIQLLGGYHDVRLEFYYPKVFSYSLSSADSTRGLGDWLYDEFTLDEKGRVVHEIEWAGFSGNDDSRWIICASDVHFTSNPR